MALATLFTHGYFLGGIVQDNWRAILDGITGNLEPYDPIYMTLDHACQYVRAMHTSDIIASVYHPDQRRVTTSLGGETDMPTMDDGTYDVCLTLTDDDGSTDTVCHDVTVQDLGPTAAFSWEPEPQDEGAAVNFTDASMSYPDAIVSWSWDSAGLASSSDQNPAFTFMDNGLHSVCLAVTDDDGSMDTICHTVTVNNVPPHVTADPAEDQTVQYSDGIQDVVFTATDVAVDTMTAATQYAVDGGGFTDGLPAFLELTDPAECSVSGDTNTCEWTLSGTVGEPEGTYTIKLTVTDKDGDQTSTDVTITVEPEDATVEFHGDNPVAVQVAEPEGDSGEFSLTVLVKETEPDAGSDPHPGNISLANVSMTLVPVGPGGSVSPMSDCASPVTGSGYDAQQAVVCSFNLVPVNTYVVQVTVDGGFYDGSAEDVLVVFDPSLGFTTGGGWFYWPGTTDKTNFGYVMKYNKKGTKVQGSLLLIRHTTNGTIYRVKSNGLYGLALGVDVSVPLGWASFSGKCTYLEPGWAEPEGNHEFLVYVEDRNEPGAGHDRFWIEVHGKDGNVIDVMSMERPSAESTVTLGGGNIVVPHKTGGKQPK